MQWKWESEPETAFEEVKKLLKSSQLLIHFDSALLLVLACDTSPHGVGAVLSHCRGDGSEKPIAFASRTLTKAERNYLQLDKEALAIIFGIKHFHEYIYSRPFTILTDHKPLLCILSKSTALVSTTQSLPCHIQYKACPAHANADTLSYLPLPADQIQVLLPAQFILAYSKWLHLYLSGFRPSMLHTVLDFQQQRISASQCLNIGCCYWC